MRGKHHKISATLLRAMARSEFKRIVTLLQHRDVILNMRNVSHAELLQAAVVQLTRAQQRRLLATHEPHRIPLVLLVWQIHHRLRTPLRPEVKQFTKICLRHLNHVLTQVLILR